MKRRRTIDQWRRDVFASRDPRMTSAVKLLCLYLADHMKQTDHTVSLPRDKIAKALGVHHARVAERLAKALDAAYLGRVAPGRVGRTAIYQAQWPSGEGRELTAPPDAPSHRRAVPTYRCSEREMGGELTALQDANTEADLSVSDADPNGSSYEEYRDTPAAYGLTACEWHRWEPCPPDCLNHPEDREESA